MLQKTRPPSTKISDWCSRFAPPLSTRLIAGSRCLSEISWARRLFWSPIGVMLPPLMAALLAVIMQRTPPTNPMPMMFPPPATFFLPSSSCMPNPARVESSTNTLPGSSRRATRSRGRSWPRFSNFARALSEWARTRASASRTASTNASISARWVAKASLEGSIADWRTGMIRSLRWARGRRCEGGKHPGRSAESERRAGSPTPGRSARRR